VEYKWFIEGESEPTLGRTIKRTFRKAGEYEVFLTVKNEAGEKNRMSRTIVVLDNQIGTEVQIESNPKSDKKTNTIQGKIPLEVEFDARSSTIRNPIEWQWDFDSNGIIDDYSSVATHVYRKPGEYKARLTIVDSLDREFSATKTILAETLGTKAVITATPSSGVAPLKVNFDGSASRTDNGKIVSYRWYLLDEEPFNYDANLEYEFDSVGTYPIKLHILTSEGKQDETTTYIVVRATPLKAYFDYTVDSENPLKVSFDPTQSTGTIIAYAWNFGDGEASRKVKPIHEFPYPGTFETVLQVRNPKGVVSDYPIKVTVGE